jgi:hypothetical protein
MQPGLSPEFNEPSSRVSWVRVTFATVLVLGVIVASYLISRPPKVDQSGQAPGYTAAIPGPTAAVSQSAGALKLKVAIVKGGQTGCQASGGCGAKSYTRLLAFDQGWVVTVLAKGGTGYATGMLSTPPENFGARLAAVVAAKPDVVIVEGSTSDTYFKQAIRQSLPKVKIITVGPLYGGSPPAEISSAEAAVAAASAGRADLYIDPIAEGWFKGQYESLMGPDHEHPSDVAHARIAKLMVQDLAKAKLAKVA